MMPLFVMLLHGRSDPCMPSFSPFVAENTRACFNRSQTTFDGKFAGKYKCDQFRPWTVSGKGSNVFSCGSVLPLSQHRYEIRNLLRLSSKTTGNISICSSLEFARHQHTSHHRRGFRRSRYYWLFFPAFCVLGLRQNSVLKFKRLGMRDERALSARL